jgi:hypothetical protein
MRGKDFAQFAAFAAVAERGSLRQGQRRLKHFDINSKARKSAP